MISHKLVSIIIPSYNCEPYIRLCIESCLNQTYENIEIIVVDDGSKDDTLAIAKEYEKQGVIVVAQPNKGAAAARNKGLDLASGEVIQFLDADDALHPEKIQIQMARYQEDTLLSGEWGRFYFDIEKTEFTKGDLWQDLKPVDWLAKSWTSGEMIQPAAWLVSRSLIDKAGRWDEKLFRDNDGEYFCRVILAAKNVEFCPGAKIYYRVGNQGALSWGRSERAMRSLYRSFTNSNRRLLAVEDSPRTRRACAQRLVFFLYETYPDLPDLAASAEQMLVDLGHGDLQPSGGRAFRLISRVVGWKAAKRMRAPYYSIKTAVIKELKRRQLGRESA